MGLKFFKLPNHRVFNYQPLYYNERKEAMQERFARIEDEERIKEGKPTEKEYVPGQHIRGNFRKAAYSSRRSTGSAFINRVIIFFSLIIIIVAVYYIAKSFGHFFSLLG